MGRKFSLSEVVNGVTRIFGITNNHLFGIMADFVDFNDDEEYGNMFIKQSAHSDNYVSLEEDGESGFKTVKDPNYSDISDDDGESEHDNRLR